MLGQPAVGDAVGRVIPRAGALPGAHHRHHGQQDPGRAARGPGGELEVTAQPLLREPPVAEHLPVEQDARRERDPVPCGELAAFVAVQIDPPDDQPMIAADPVEDRGGHITEPAVGLSRRRDLPGLGHERSAPRRRAG